MIDFSILQKQLLEACNFINKEILAQVFSCEFCEISKNILFTEHLRATASDSRKNIFLLIIQVIGTSIDWISIKTLPNNYALSKFRYFPIPMLKSFRRNFSIYFGKYKALTKWILLNLPCWIRHWRSNL